jgi:D-glycero-D-manno-heptose 1,7-bisphosphate phosphatase
MSCNFIPMQKVLNMTNRLEESVMKESAVVFLDRDGVINEDRPDYVKDWTEFRFLKGVFPFLMKLHQARIKVVVISNQSAVGRGLITREKLDAMHERMVGAIQKKGGLITGIYYCPHHPDDRCSCRKPQTGLLKKAARELNLDLKKSIFIGDSLKDIQAGKMAGCRTILVLTGQGEKTLATLLGGKTTVSPDLVVPDLSSGLPFLKAWLQGHSGAN